MRKSGSVGCLLAFALLLAPDHARGASAKQCIQAHESGQKLQRETKLREARQQFVTCGGDGCPAVIQKECAALLAEVEKNMPTLVFSARDGERDVSDVSVEVDGERVANQLDGKAIELDPGEHEVRFKSASGERQLSIVVREGEKNRKVSVQFKEDQPELPSQPAPAQPPSADMGGGPPVLAYVLGGVALIGVGGFTVFALDGRKKERDLEDSCAPRCSDGDLDPMRRSYLIADVSLGVGVVALGVATYLFLKPSKESVERQSRPRIDVASGPGGGVVSLSGVF